MEEQENPRPSSGSAVDDSEPRLKLGAANAIAAPTGLWDAIWSNIVVVIAAVVVITAVALAAGLSRAQKYSSTTTLSVLHLDFGVPGALSGFSTAAAALADTYARAIRADGIVLPVAAQLHASPTTIRGDLSAAAVPSSPVFTVTATTAKPARSIDLANLAAAQLQTYIQAVNASNPDAPRLYRKLSHAESNLSTKQEDLTSLQASLSHVHILSLSDQTAVAKAHASVSIAQDQVNGLRSAYTQSVVGQSTTQFLQPLQAANSATSDRKKKLELFGFVGVVAGLGVGVGLALLLEARRRRVRVF
jgi:capsular polysaccharide biosynthesis protein